MPLIERDINTAGRSSRASNLSDTSRGYPKPPPAAMTKADMLTSAPGVMSMLKSSTEVGSESLIMPGSRFSSQKRNSNRRSGTASRLSTGSSHSQHSRPTSGHHSHHAWPSISSGGRRMSITSNFSNLNTPQHYLNMMPPPSLGNLSDPASLPLPAPHFRESGRSLSLTNSIPQPYGLANYRSLSSLRGQESYPRPRSPYRYPTRLKRPGYRPASPAMSDITGAVPTRGHHHRPGSGLRMAHGAQGSQGSHGSHGPFLPALVRPAPMYHGTRNRSSPSVHSIGPLDYMPGMYPPSLPASRQGTPSIPEQTFPMMTPTNSIAAKSSQQSSDPPSSTPPTPRNPLASVSVEPTIIAIRHAGQRRGSGASITMPTYYDYSENFDPVPKETTQMLPAALMTPPSIGFVQRIRTILEERKSYDCPTEHEYVVAMDDLAEEPPNHVDEVHELPASPVIKRIMRDLVRSNLQLTSESEYSTTPTIPTGMETGMPDCIVDREPPTRPPSDPVPKIAPNQAHERVQSKVSGHTSMRSDTTTATAAMDYALRSSPPPEEGTTMSDFLNTYGNEDGHMTTVIEEPTEPVTIATAEVEVTAPTPTQPRWKPNFNAAPDLLRPRSAVLPSSSYTSSDKDSSSRYSTPLTPTIWLPTGSAPARAISPGVQPASAPLESKLSSTQENEPPRQVLAIPNQSNTGRCTPLSCPPSIPRKEPSFEQPTPPSRPLSASRRELKVEQHIMRPKSPPGTLSESKHESATLNCVPSSFTIRQSLQARESTVSPVSPLSEFNIDHFNTFSPSPVSPLLSPELAINKRDSNVSSIWSYRKPVPKRPDSPASISTRASVRESDPVNEQSADRESTTDLRFSALGFRPLVRHLDDVKEEPSLEASTVDLKASTFKFPLPQRKSSLAHYEEFRLSRESKRKVSLEVEKAIGTAPHPAAASDTHEARISPLRAPAGVVTLGEQRSIPSLHFSRVDLFSKLNEALDLQPDPPEEELPEAAGDEIQARPESTGPLRQKYRSFFESLDNMASDAAALPESQNDGGILQSYEPASDGAQSRPKHVVLPKIQQWTPDDLMAEIDRLSIPSINGLTQRLSELLPSLRRYYGEHGELADEDETVRSALKEIRRLGAELIPGMRDSASFMSEDDGDLFEEATATSSSSSGQGSLESTIKVRTRPRSASSPGDIPCTPLAELEAHAPVIARSRSLTHGNAGTKRVSVAATENSRASRRRSAIGSPPESRPWNLDTSYPWANNIPPIDISLPAPTLRRDHIKPRPSRLRLRDDILDSGATTTDISAASVCSEITETTTGGRTFSITPGHRRRYSKRSILGSISRKLGLPRTTSIDNSGYATGPDILRGEDRTVDPGDRYPTTGLSPPSALNIDEVRSFFSDDSSHLEMDATPRVISLRKRFSNLRTKLPAVARTHSALEQRPMPTGPVLRRSNSLFSARSMSKPINTAEFDAHVDEASGMPKTEVRAKKLVNRMKTLWYKGGELLRTMSGKRKPGNSQDWDESGDSTVWSNV